MVFIDRMACHMMISKMLIILLSFFTLFSSTYALYEDQAGLWDWKQSYVGKVQFVHPLYVNGQHWLVVGAESGVIASISTRNGSLHWRKALETRHGLQAIASVSHQQSQPEGELLTITSNGEHLRSWHLQNGFLHWERRLPEQMLAGDELSDPDQTIKLLFHIDNRSPQVVSVKFIRSLADNQQIQSVQLHVFDYVQDRLIVSKEVKPSGFLQWQHIGQYCKFVSIKALICVDPIKLEFHHIWTETAEHHVNTLTSLQIHADSKQDTIDLVTFRAQPNPHDPLLSFSVNGNRFSLLRLHKSQIQLVKRFEDVQGLAVGEAERNQKMEHALFAINSIANQPGQQLVRVYDLERFEEIPTLSETFEVKNTGQPLNVESLFILPFKKSHSRFNYKIAISTKDASFILASSKHSSLGWLREESLAGIISSEILDLPLSNLDENIESALGTFESDLISQFLKRINLQVNQLQLYLKELAASIASPKVDENAVETSSLGYAKHEHLEERLMRDKFGFHKLIVVLTKYGKLLGLDTISGKIIWSLYDPQLGSGLHDHLWEQGWFYDTKKAKKVPIFVQRTTSHHPFQAICTIVLKNGYIFSFDPITGKTLDQVHLDNKPKQVLLLNHHNKDNLKAILILDHQNRVSTYPSIEYEDVFLDVKDKYFMTTVEPNTGLVEGFAFNKLTSTQRVAERVWTFKIPISQPGKNHLQVIFKPQLEHVHSLGRVLGDRNVLYKYLNPNLMAIINEELDTNVTASETTFGDFHTVSVYLVDAVNGQLIYSTHHRRACNVFAVHSENSLVYAFYNEKQRRTEVNSLDLYEGPTMANSTTFSSLNRPFYVQPALVHHNSFIFPTGITAMSDTKTEQGLTNKHLIISLPYGGILQLPKVFVDPRRPLNPTPEHREEGLLPYMPELPIPAEGIINYNQSVINVNDIITAPATLESTSLLFVHGLDLFYTRVTPSKTFDILKEDFDHWFIVAVLLLLFALYYLSKYFSNQKTLHNAWK